ncbi:NADP-dependent malic enzyme [Patescibacteria group bacterium]|nr:NADP-dependent malic enzyme [Patescibacteria group bacterium]
MNDIYQEALEFHQKHKGKLSINSKVSLKDKKSLSLAYTPGVAEVCRLIASDKEAAKTHTIKGNTIAVVSDGSAILGLGNLGPEAALPVMEGKCALFKEFAGVDAFPICLATQDTEEIIKAVKQISPVFGGINLEDISAPRCFEIEARLKAELDIPVFHDDQHGTATVVLAALINALKLSGLEKEKVRLVVNGAGAAGDAVSRLLLSYGFKDLIVVDSKGAISKNRQDLNSAKIELANLTNPRNIEGALAEALVGANIFIGVSAPGVLNEEIIKTMSEKPIVFALANPVPEIMPDLAKKAGAYIVATGRSDFPNQINNVLAFPGIFRGALDNKVKDITDSMLVQAAINLAALVEDLDVDKILPDPFDERVARAVAEAIR